MSIHPRAGQISQAEDRENIAQLVTYYYIKQPDVSNEAQRVSFGTSGHRGNAKKISVNEYHMIAICQAVAEYRNEPG